MIATQMAEFLEQYASMNTALAIGYEETIHVLEEDLPTNDAQRDKLTAKMLRCRELNLELARELKAAAALVQHVADDIED